MKSIFGVKLGRITIELPASRTISSKGIVQFRLGKKAVANVFPHKTEPSSATRTGQYLLD